MSKSKYTKQDRADAVEILRCAFDRQTYLVDVAIELGRNGTRAHKLAESAFYWEDVPYPGRDGGYLDAAIALEEGRDP